MQHPAGRFTARSFLSLAAINAELVERTRALLQSAPDNRQAHLRIIERSRAVIASARRS